MTTPEGAPMRMTIDEMLRKAAAHQMTPAERREQRISFVYGQMIDCAPEITREQVAKTVDEYDASLAAGVTKLLQNLRAASANLFREDLLHDSGLMREAADLIESLSASYSAACGERDKHRKHAAVSDGDVLTLSERLEAAESQLSLALVERDRARTDALEEAAKLCIAIRDANFANLPDYENEPDFSTEDVCGEDVCAWHIRAAKARPAIKSPAPIPAHKHELVGGTLTREDGGIYARCTCGWSSGGRFSPGAASAAFQDHQEHQTLDRSYRAAKEEQ